MSEVCEDVTAFIAKLSCLPRQNGECIYCEDGDAGISGEADDEELFCGSPGAMNLKSFTAVEYISHTLFRYIDRSVVTTLMYLGCDKDQ